MNSGDDCTHQWSHIYASHADEGAIKKPARWLGLSAACTMAGPVGTACTMAGPGCSLHDGRACGTACTMAGPVGAACTVAGPVSTACHHQACFYSTTATQSVTVQLLLRLRARSAGSVQPDVCGYYLPVCRVLKYCCEATKLHSIPLSLTILYRQIYYVENKT